MGLSVDKSYTVAISRQLALSYYDHPPLHVWLVGTWAKLVGHEDSWIARTLFIILLAGTTWIMFRLTACAFGDRAGFWATLALSLAPLFTIGAASWVLLDGPLAFFSLLAVWLSLRANSVRAPDYHDYHPSGLPPHSAAREAPIIVGFFVLARTMIAANYTNDRDVSQREILASHLGLFPALPVEPGTHPTSAGGLGLHRFFSFHNSKLPYPPFAG